MAFSPELDPNAEVAADTTAEAGTGTAPTPGQERTFTQADVDRIAANERSRSRRWYERELANAPKPQTQPQGTIDPITGEIQSIKQQMLEFQLDGAIASLSKRYPEFGDDKTLREILETVVDMGLDKTPNLPINTVLELAFRNWDHQRLVSQPKPDLEAIKKQAADQAVKDYIAKKSGTAAATPRTVGAGGSSAPVTETKILRGKDMVDYGLQVLENSR